MLSFWSSITVEAIFGILNNSSSGRKDIQHQKTEDLALRVLPVLNNCMRSKYGAEAVTACYTIVVILVNQAKLGNKMLDGLMEAVILAHDEASINECLACLAIIATARPNAQIPEKVYKRLLRIPLITQKLLFISRQCQVERLALGCALGALSGLDSDAKRNTFYELMESGLLTEARLRIVLSALSLLLRHSAPGSEEHGLLLEVCRKLAESKHLLHILQATAKQNDVNLELLGSAIEQPLEEDQRDAFDSENDDMLDEHEQASELMLAIQVPNTAVTSFLDPKSNHDFVEMANIFEQAVTAKQTKRFLASEVLGEQNALQQTRYISFLIRIWCSFLPVSVRVAALRAAAITTMRCDAAHTLQNIVPYLLHALADPSPLVRRASAACIANWSGKTPTVSKAQPWGSSDMYDEESGKIAGLKEGDVAILLSNMLKPILEECVMDSNFAITAVRDMLEGSQSLKNQPKQAFKAQSRSSILSFFASHANLTPLLRVRLSLLPIFGFPGKSSDTIRSNVVLPIVRKWCALSAADAISLCKNAGIPLEEAERLHMSALIAREAKSVQMLQELLLTDTNKERITSINAAFDRVNTLWSSMKPDSRLSLAQCLLDLSMKESSDTFDRLCCERALETLRNVKLDTPTLLAFLESVPSAVQMPEGPPAKKRRRTSRNEMARVELSSQHDVQRLLRRLTLVLELIEESNPAQHLALFRTLFTVFGDLQPLKQQSGSELVYLQSMILGSLAPIVNTLKASAKYVTPSNC